jgi:hypothetical protein
MNTSTPAEIMIGLYMQYWQSLAILTAANLGIADELSAGPCDVDELAQRLNAHPQALFRLLRALSSKGIFRQEGECQFANSRFSESLRTGAPGGAREVIRSVGLSSTRAACAAYEQAITSGRSAIEAVQRGVGAFEHLAQDADEAAIYDLGMTAAAIAHAEAINQALDFSPYALLVDIGGGQGALLASILARTPTQRGILFDVARVVAGAEDLLRRRNVLERCEVRAGDFRIDLPAGGDAYLLKNVLHGYDDALCTDLLARIRARAQPDAHLFIIELVMPAGPPSAAQASFDLFLLLGGVQSRVRSEAEFRQLLRRSGFELLRLVPTTCPACILEARSLQNSGSLAR